MKFPTSKFITSAISGLMLCFATAEAQTVAWGTSFSTAGPIAFNSDGSVDNAQNLWTLGYFNTGFDPDATNYMDWADNWNRVSNIVAEEYPPGSGTLGNYPQHINYGDNDFPFWMVSMNNLDVGPAAAGKQVYVFAYNDLGLIGTAQGEALLYRQDGLLFPSIPNQITFDIADGPEAADNNFTVIWGRVDRNMMQIGGVLQGGGIITSLVPDSAAPEGEGTFEAQFGTWAPIPEPSSVLLSILGATICVFRRRR